MIIDWEYQLIGQGSPHYDHELPHCEEIVEASTLRMLAEKCVSRELVTFPSGQAGRLLHAMIWAAKIESGKRRARFSVASMLMGLAEEGDWRP